MRRNCFSFRSRFCGFSPGNGFDFRACFHRGFRFDWSRFGRISSLGLTAGASAPETLVEEVIAAFAERFTVSVETVRTAEETIAFNLPRELRDVTGAQDAAAE